MQNHRPTVTVLMPVFNGERFVADAIASILAQTFADFEFLIVNDGSTDGTGAILHQLAATDDRIHLIEQRNRGLTYSLNEGISMARGDWIARMDADDVAHPRRFELQLKRLTERAADVIGSAMRLVGTRLPSVVKFPLDDESCRLRMIFRSPLAHPTVMIRTELAQALRYDEQYLRAQDYELWTRCAMHGAKLANCPEPLLHYRQHASQISIRDSVSQKHFFSSAHARYCASLGISSSHFPLIERFSGKGSTATWTQADELASLMSELDGFSGASRANEFCRRLLDVRPASWKLLAKSKSFARVVNAAHRPGLALVATCLIGETVSSRLRAQIG